MAMKSEASRTLFVTALATVVVTGLFGASSVQAATYTWKGSGGNNNWQNKGNWTGASGYPNSVSDSVIFPSVNTNHEEVDLSGATRRVLGMTFHLSGTDSYLFRSSSSGGNLRNFGGLTSTDARPVTFDSSMTYTQADAGNPLNSVWTLNADPQYMVFNGNVAGSSFSSIRLHGGVTLNHANTYSGTFIVASDGVLKLGHYNAMHNAAVVLNANNGLKFDTSSININLGSLAGNATGLLNLGAHTLTVGSLNTDTTYAGSLRSTAVSGGVLYKAGTGAMTLSGTIAGLHQLRVNGGSMTLDGNTVNLVAPVGINLAGGDMSIVNNANVTLAGTGGTAAIHSQTLTIDGGHLAVGQITSDAGGKVALTNASTGPGLTIGRADGQSVSSTFNGQLTGNGSFDKVGSGTLTLPNALAFSGTAIIDGGSVVLGDAASLAHAAVQINADNGLDITTNTLDATIGALSGSGSLDLGSQTLTVQFAGNSTYAGVLSGTDASRLLKRGSGTLTLTGGDTTTPSTLGSIQSTKGKIVINNAVIQLGSGESFSKGSTLIITGPNTQLTGSQLQAAHAANQGGTIAIKDQANVVLSGTLYAGYAGSGSLKINSGAHVTADTLGVATHAGNSTLYSNAAIADAGTTVNVNHLSIGSQISGTQGQVSVTSGADVQVAGDTTIHQGIGSLTINGATLSTDTLVNDSSGSPKISISDPASGGHALTVGVNNGSSTWDSVIEDAAGGAGSIQKNGGGTLSLSGANTYSGGTTVDGGTLLADNTTGSATGTGAVVVNSGATLGGSGFIGGPVTVNAGGMIAPGNSPGLLSINNNLTLGSGSIFDIQLAGLIPGSQYDVLDVSGNVDLGGSTLDVSLLGPFTLGPNQEFDILNVGGSLSGMFANLGEGDLVGDFGGRKLFITYTAGTGNDIALYTTSAVPEPASFLLFGLGGLAVISWGRRRRC